MVVYTEVVAAAAAAAAVAAVAAAAAAEELFCVCEWRLCSAES